MGPMRPSSLTELNRLRRTGSDSLLMRGLTPTRVAPTAAGGETKAGSAGVTELSVIMHARMRSQRAMSDVWMEVRLEFLSTDEGGRATPVRSGYRPLLRLAGAGELYGMAEVVFLVDEWVEPGGGSLARIRLGAPEVLPVLEAGDEFEVIEPPRVVARGRVINPPTITR